MLSKIAGAIPGQDAVLDYSNSDGRSYKYCRGYMYILIPKEEKNREMFVKEVLMLDASTSIAVPNLHKILHMLLNRIL